MLSYDFEFGPHEVVCREGDPSSDLLYLQSGKLLVCTINGTEVKAIAKIEPGEFIGELSFFDNRPRSTHIVTLEKSVLVQIPKQELSEKLPFWYLETHKALTQKIRKLDQVIQETKIRKSDAEESKPLSIEIQRKLFELLTK